MLNIKYRPVLEQDPKYQEKVDTLLDELDRAGIAISWVFARWCIRTQFHRVHSHLGFVKPIHKNDGHLTWFKLPEWMQVAASIDVYLDGTYI